MPNQTGDCCRCHLHWFDTKPKPPLRSCPQCQHSLSPTIPGRGWEIRERPALRSWWADPTIPELPEARIFNPPRRNRSIGYPVLERKVKLDAWGYPLP